MPQRQTPPVRKEALLLSTDIIACSGSMGIALALRFPDGVPDAHLILYLNYLPFVLVWRLFIASTAGLYDFRHRVTLTDHVFGSAGAAIFGAGGGYIFLALIAFYYDPAAQLSRIVAALDIVFVGAWFAVSRGLVIKWLRATGYRVRVAVVGALEAAGPLAEEIARYAPRLVSVSGIVTPDAANTPGALGNVDQLPEIVERENIAQLVLAQGDLPQAEFRRVLSQCDHCSTDLYLYPGLGLSILANSRVISIGGVPLISLRPAIEHSPYRVGKRVLDVAAALIGLLLCALPMAIVTLAIRMQSPGPALFRQERAGLHGRVFRICKFRTMVADAEARTGPVLSSADDARITPLGRFLRRTRLDELPQLWNVLVGDMSLVGPRPERPEFIARFIEEDPLYERRALLKPGLTGLAQIHGRYDTGYAHKLRYDLIYINSVSAMTDLRILLATIRTVLLGEGAI
ncbi:MAG: sugar transferase [Candidatus Hydrogenedentota bacterium]